MLKKLLVHNYLVITPAINNLEHIVLGCSNDFCFLLVAQGFSLLTRSSNEPDNVLLVVFRDMKM